MLEMLLDFRFLGRQPMTSPFSEAESSKIDVRRRRRPSVRCPRLPLRFLALCRSASPPYIDFNSSSTAGSTGQSIPSRTIWAPIIGSVKKPCYLVRTIGDVPVARISNQSHGICERTDGQDRHWNVVASASGMQGVWALSEKVGSHLNT